MQFIADGFTAVLDFIQSAIDAVIAYLHAHAQWILDLWELTPLMLLSKTWNFFIDAVNGKIAQLPLVPSFSWELSFITSPMWVLLNEWVPVGYCFVCLGIYVTLAIGVYTVNWILGAIPTVS